MVYRGYTVSEFSRLTGMSRTTIRKKISDGSIPCEIDSSGKKWIPEEYVFKNYKMLVTTLIDDTQDPDREFSLQEALLYITQRLYEITDKLDNHSNEMGKIANRIFNENGLLTEKVSKQLVKLIRKQLMDDILKEVVKESLVDVLNDPKFFLVMKKIVKRAIDETSNFKE